MQRRKALKIITLGLLGASLAHPKSRRRILRTGKKGFELYKSTMIKLSEKKELSESERAAFRTRFNFASRKEEDEFVREFLKEFQEIRIRDQAFFKRKITDRELAKQIDKLTQRRKEFAKAHLEKASFEGKKYTRADVSRALIRYFELNQRELRVPSEIEIRDMIDNGVEYK